MERSAGASFGERDGGFWGRVAMYEDPWFPNPGFRNPWLIRGHFPVKQGFCHRLEADCTRKFTRKFGRLFVSQFLVIPFLSLILGWHLCRTKLPCKVFLFKSDNSPWGLSKWGLKVLVQYVHDCL